MKPVFLSIITFILCLASLDIFAAVERTSHENKDQTGLTENSRNNKSGSLSTGKILRNIVLGKTLFKHKNPADKQQRNDNIRFSMISLMASIVAWGLVILRFNLTIKIALVLSIAAIVLGAIGLSKDKYWGVAIIALLVGIGVFAWRRSVT